MTRILAAAALLLISSASAFACPFTDAASADIQSSTVAAQQSNQATLPPSTPSDQNPS